MEGTRPTLTYTSLQGLKDTEHLRRLFPGPENGKTLAEYKSLVHQYLDLMAFWENWWFNSPALKKYSSFL